MKPLFLDSVTLWNKHTALHLMEVRNDRTVKEISAIICSTENGRENPQVITYIYFFNASVEQLIHHTTSESIKTVFREIKCATDVTFEIFKNVVVILFTP